MNKEVNFSILTGGIIKSVKGLVNDSDEVTFEMEDGCIYRMTHYQDCCERVTVEEIHGDTNDLISTVVSAEEVSDYEGPDKGFRESYTWTFYKIQTLKGAVTIRWLGESNGYYSERVTFERIA